MFVDFVEIIPSFTKELIEKKSVDCEYPGNDYSLFMTVAALFYRRWPEFNLHTRIYTNLNSSDFMNKLQPREEALSFYWVKCGNDPTEHLSEEWKALPDHENFLTEKLGQHIYIRVFGDKTVAIFYENFCNQLYHVSQAFIRAYFPSFFEEGVKSETETNLLKTLTKNYSDNYRKEMENLLEDPEFKRFLLESQLAGFEKGIRQRSYEAATAEVSKCMNRMDDCLKSYREACKAKREADLIVNGLFEEMRKLDIHTELEDYLCRNKLLSDIEIDGDHIHFIVKTFVSPYRPDEWEILSNRGSIFEGYDNTGSVLDDKENMKLLLDAIFSKDNTLNLRMCAYFDIDYYGSSCKSVTNYDYAGANPTLKNYVPNFHLQKYNCFGQNMDDILDRLADGDIIGAIECCINVTRRVNVVENATFEPFINYLKRTKGKCIVTKDGQEMTIKEAVQYLKEKNDETASDESRENEVA